MGMAESPRVFVSYAGEDREIAKAVARDLTAMGIPTFYDRDSLALGDSVVDRIHEAMSVADYGVLIVSPDFLSKNWPRHETRQLVQDYIEGRTRLLPIWHDVSMEEVREHQPALSGIWAANTDEGLRSVVRALAAQMTEAATVAVVPTYQQPVERFLAGTGELTQGIEGPAFTMWEALVHMDGEEFPIFVDGRMLERGDLLVRACALLAEGDPDFLLNPNDLRQLKSMCEAL